MIAPNLTDVVHLLPSPRSRAGGLGKGFD